MYRPVVGYSDNLYLVDTVGGNIWPNKATIVCLLTGSPICMSPIIPCLPRPRGHDHLPRRSPAGRTLPSRQCSPTTAFQRLHLPLTAAWKREIATPRCAAAGDSRGRLQLSISRPFWNLNPTHGHCYLHASPVVIKPIYDHVWWNVVDL
jgi:hypothetical protein